MVLDTLHRGLNVLLQRSLDTLTAGQVRSFHRDGYLILRGFFSAGHMAAIRAHIDDMWATRARYPNVPIDAFLGEPRSRRMYFRKAPIEARNFSYKLLDLHLDDPTIRDLSAAPGLIDAVRTLLGANPLVCNSLLFERGSQQEPHFDTFFMPSRTPNMMAASWIALDPVTSTNGPLYYYPGSHLIEPYRFSNGKISAVWTELKTGAAAHIERIIAEHRLERRELLAEPGDVLIWHAQLLHGGSPILNPAETRRSLVTHYWTDIDFPDEAQRLDLGDRRWVLKRDHQFVADEDIFVEVDAFLATLDVPDSQRTAVPAHFYARRYLAHNQDVLRAGVNPWQHYIEHGREEGRSW